MGIIGTLFIGLIVGLIARFLKPGDDSMGWIMTILLGIGGSLLAAVVVWALAGFWWSLPLWIVAVFNDVFLKFQV